MEAAAGRDVSGGGRVRGAREELREGEAAETQAKTVQAFAATQPEPGLGPGAEGKGIREAHRFCTNKSWFIRVFTSVAAAARATGGSAGSAGREPCVR